MTATFYDVNTKTNAKAEHGKVHSSSFESQFQFLDNVYWARDYLNTQYKKQGLDFKAVVEFSD